MSQAALPTDLNLQTLPDFFPERLRLACAGKNIKFRIPSAVKERMQVPENITISEHAEKYRRVTSIDAHPGRWRNELMPHGVKPMDTIGLPHVRQVWLCWPERAGKTNVILNAACWQIDRGVDSGNIFWLMPREKDARDALGERIIPTLKASPRMARLLSRYADDATRGMVRFRTGARLLPAWANSPASVASYFGFLNVADEIDKFELGAIDRETDILTLLFKRGRDRDDSKYLLASTPAQGFIYDGTMGCEQVFSYRPRCPHCGDLIDMDTDHFDIPANATAEEVKHGKHKIVYGCNSCGAEWNEAARALAYRMGAWVCIKGQDVDRPETVGFHMSAFVIPNVPMREIAEKIVLARSGEVAAKRALDNGYKVINHKEEIIDRKEDQILRLRDDRPEGLVPSVPIAAITAVADMQKRGFWVKITAWGFGLELESWLLRAGYVDSWEALRKLFFETEFRDVKGNRYVVTLRALDSGGGESEEWADLSRTAEAYLFACANPGILLFKGQRTMSSPYQHKIVDRLPGTNKPLPGAPYLYTLNSKHYKDQLAAKLLVDPTSPGAWHLHSGYTAEQGELLRRDPSLTLEHNLNDLARQMCVEGKDEKGGFWINPKKRANHLWDDAYMELALVDIAQVKFMKQPTGPVSSGRRVLSAGV